jgi:phosphoribosylanthranilate isomerase
MKIKICGITSVKEAEYLNKYKADFAGMVMFFPKSKRNIEPDQAKDIMEALDFNIKTVAVVVSPTIEQALNIQDMGFDYIQIHGSIPDKLFEIIDIPVLKAYNITDLDNFNLYSEIQGIAGYVFDAADYGGGKTFDWNILKDIPRDNKMFLLAGGLNPDNVAEAIKYVHPDGVDVSSGVENDNGVGKNEQKIKEFIEHANNVEKL